MVNASHSTYFLGLPYPLMTYTVPPCACCTAASFENTPIRVVSSASAPFGNRPIFSMLKYWRNGRLMAWLLRESHRLPREIVRCQHRDCGVLDAGNEHRDRTRLNRELGRRLGDDFAVGGDLARASREHFHFAPAQHLYVA